jgi:SAM-dependent methyltransferase
MAHSFDKDYWDQHWGETSSATDDMPPNPYLIHETSELPPGTALDAGCGTGTEAIWLATQGWQVTAADISADALARAARKAAENGQSVSWIEADLTAWEPGRQFDLVTTNYAHPAMPQLAFYDRVSDWVAPGGTLLIVGHRHAASAGHGHGHGHGHERSHENEQQPPPAEASVTLNDITARLDTTAWQIDTAEEHARTLIAPGGQSVSLQDVVVRATRRP